MSVARERILDTASSMFYAHGIRGVGLDSIIAAAGVAKATLYSHFPSKDDLVLAYLVRADNAWQGRLHAAAGAAGDDPRDQLIGLFDALHEACAQTGFRGCAFVNTAAESAPGTVVHGATVTHKRAVRTWITTLARSAGAADPTALALALTVILDGALITAALEPRPEIAVQARLTARTLVEATCPGRSGTVVRPRDGHQRDRPLPEGQP